MLPGTGLDPVKTLDLGNIPGRVRPVGFERLDELAPDMYRPIGDLRSKSAVRGHAGDFIDVARTVQLFEPCIPIRMHPTLVILEVFAGAYAFAVWCELIPCRRWCIAAPRAFMSVICPEAGCLCLAVARCQHLNGRIIRKDGLTV